MSRDLRNGGGLLGRVTGPRELAKVPLNLLRAIRDVVAYRQFTRVVAVGPAVYRSLTGPFLRLQAARGWT